jgi:hypothetical protein
MQNVESNTKENKKPLKKEDELLLVSNHITSNIKNEEKEKENLNNNNNVIHSKDIAIDTKDLIIENEFDFQSLKQNYINNLISWSFLKKLSDYNQWPLVCIGNIIENSLKTEVGSKNIYLDCRAYNKHVYCDIEKLNSEEKFRRHEGIHLSKVDDFTSKTLCLTIKDDGKGISTPVFNKFIYSLSSNENEEFDFFQYGISLKTSAVRLCNSFFIITKTKNELNIGLLSKSLINKLNSDFIFTPIVNYSHNYNKIYTAKSILSNPSLKFILGEIKFLFFDQEELFEYIESINTGTHIFLYDLKQISSKNSDLYTLKNYELFFDYENWDIYYRFFDIQVGERNYIDCSLIKYLTFMNLEFKKDCNLYIFGKQILLINPMKRIFQYLIENKNEKIPLLKHNLKYEGNTVNGFVIKNEIYNGLLFNEELISEIRYNLNKDNKEDLEDKINYNNIDNLNNNNNNIIEKEDLKDIDKLFNGILLYSNNRLITRSNQYKLGEISYFVKKFENYFSKKKDEYTKYLFPISGFMELPSETYATVFNKTVKFNIFLYFFNFL